MADRWATFDCYGTLIDWNAGIRACLGGLWPEADAERLLRRFHRLEPGLEADGSRSYRQVLSEILVGIAVAEGLVVAQGKGTALADSLPSWPPFPEVPGALTELREHGWKLAILSNTDPDYLAASIASIGVPIDVTIAASEIGSYKPSFTHWETFFRRTGADPTGHVHVAASLFHDVEPCAKLGLSCVWINRLGETSELPRAAELVDLGSLPGLLERLVSA